MRSVGCRAAPTSRCPKADRGGDPVVIGDVGVDQLVEHSPAHRGVFQRVERLGELVGSGVFVISDVEDRRALAGQLWFVFVRVVHPTDAL